MKRHLFAGLFVVAGCGSTTTNYYLPATATDASSPSTSVSANDGKDASSTTTDSGVAPPTDAPPTGVAGLTVNCSVPYILDGTKVGDQTYMVQHFSHLVQQYCITGIVRGADITAYPEKMYYGSHTTGALGLYQVAMQQTTLTPTYSVKMDFKPDSAAKQGSDWGVGLTEQNDTTLVAVYKHLSMSQMCLFAIGTGGKVTFDKAQNTTKEGGSFTLKGLVNVTDPKDVPTVCDDAASTSAPCCS